MCFGSSGFGYLLAILVHNRLLAVLLQVMRTTAICAMVGYHVIFKAAAFLGGSGGLGYGGWRDQ